MPPRIPTVSDSALASSSRTAGELLITGRDANGGPVTAAKLRPFCGRNLADRAFHLKFDQALQFDRVFHRKLPNEIVNESVHAQAHRLRFSEAALLHVKDLLGADLADTRFVLYGVAGAANGDGGIGVGTTAGVDEERVA